MKTFGIRLLTKKGDNTMLTIDNLLDYTNLEGPVRVTRWTDDGCEVLFEDDAWELSRVDADWMNTEIRVIFPGTDGKLVIEVA